MQILQRLLLGPETHAQQDGLWIPTFSDSRGAGIDFLDGTRSLSWSLQQDASGPPRVLFPFYMGGVVAELEGRRWLVRVDQEPKELHQVEVKGVDVRVRGYIGPSALCGTLRRPIAGEPERLMTYAFCYSSQGRLWEVEVGRDVELLPLEGGEGWRLIWRDFLALRIDGEARSLVRIIPDTLEMLPYPVEVIDDPTTGRTFPRALWSGINGRLYGIHRDETGADVAGEFTREGFVPFPYRIDGARSLESVHVNELIYLRAVVEECGEDGCAEREQVVRFDRVRDG